MGHKKLSECNSYNFTNRNKQGDTRKLNKTVVIDNGNDYDR